ncbi:helix-turn-helix transcriptional regulator [Natrialbaceae archaeon GCM10025810]|uniref:helix-turn-helix transcriptional regulator n=1 Tax=Halovalidus salilacus TaxID=3075124 RepID=UPI00362338B3
MDAVLEEIEFLALSANRVAVLDALRGGTHTRVDLEAETGASQPTLGRILRDFGERNWTERTADGYALTATGRLIADGITDLRAIVETELKLRDVVEWLPADALTFDLLALRDATITVPTRTRPSAPLRRSTGLIGRAGRVRIVSHTFNERSLEAVRRRTVEGDGAQSFEAAFSREAIDALAEDDDLRDRLVAVLESDAAEIRVCDDAVPFAVTITEDVVQLLLRDDDGVLQAALESDDEGVRSWAREVFDRYWRDATPLAIDALESGGEGDS